MAMVGAHSLCCFAPTPEMINAPLMPLFVISLLIDSLQTTTAMYTVVQFMQLNCAALHRIAVGKDNFEEDRGTLCSNFVASSKTQKACWPVKSGRHSRNSEGNNVQTGEEWGFAAFIK